MGKAYFDILVEFPGGKEVTIKATELNNYEVLMESTSVFMIKNIATGKVYRVKFISLDREGRKAIVIVNGKVGALKWTPQYMLTRKKGEIQGGKKLPRDMVIKAPLPGKVKRLFAREGDRVEKGDFILTIEAMKMENMIVAEASGVIEKIHVEEGKVVKGGDILCIIRIN